MPILVGFQGHRFDNEVPLIVTTDTDWAFHRKLRKIISLSAIQRDAANAGYTWQENEVGNPPQWWIDANNVGLNFTADSGGVGGFLSQPYRDWPTQMTGSLFVNIEVNGNDYDIVDVLKNRTRANSVRRVVAWLNTIDGIVARNLSQEMTVAVRPEDGYQAENFVMGFREKTDEEPTPEMAEEGAT